MYKQIIITILFLFSFLETLEAVEEGEQIRIGYYINSLTDIDKKDVEISLKLWTKELERFADINIHATFYYSTKNLKEDFENKKIDFLVASPLVIIKNFDLNAFQDGFAGVGDDNKDEILFLLVRKDSKIETLKDLKHKKIAMLKNADIDQLFLDSLLVKEGKKDSKNFFKKIIYIKKRSQSILKLFFKKVDAAFVTQKAFELASELNPQIEKHIKVIKRKKAYSQNAGYFRKDFDPVKLKKMTDTAFKLHTLKRGKQLLTLYKSTKLVKSKVEDIRNIKKVYQEYLALKQ